MAYEPTTWKSGDVVTSAKLNKLEKGVQDAGPLFIGYATFDVVKGTGTLDHTWQEIHDAMASGRLVVLSRTTTDESATFDIVTKCNVTGDDEYNVGTIGDDFTASSPDGYPSNRDDGPLN